MFIILQYIRDLCKRRKPITSSDLLLFPHQTHVRGTAKSFSRRPKTRFAILALVAALSTVAPAAQLTLSWSDLSDNEDGFSIERSDNGSPFTQIDTVAANTTTYTDANLAPSAVYSYRLNAYNQFGASGYTNTASATTAPLNTPPVISAISDQSTFENVNAGPISFTISDAESPAQSLIITATSSNQTLVPNGNIVISGSGSSRTATIAPSASLTGNATITITLSDGIDSASESFLTTVDPTPIPESDTIQLSIEEFAGGLYPLGQSDAFKAVVTGAQSTIQRVEFFDNGELVNTALNAPYDFTFIASASGNHALKIVVTTDSGVYENSFSAIVGTPPDNPDTLTVASSPSTE